jgi:hypothetical protein
VSKEKEVNRARKIDNRRRRTHDPAWSIPQGREDVFNRDLFWARDARVVPPKRVQLVRIRRGNKRLTKLCGHFYGSAVQIENSFMKMTQLDRVEAIDLLEKPFAD